MDSEAIKARVESLLKEAGGQLSLELQNRLYHGTLTIIQSLYGLDSSQERDLRAAIERVSKATSPTAFHTISSCISIIRGVVEAIRDEISAGLLGSLRRNITGDVLSDLVKLARTALEEQGDAAKNVAAVLAAAAFEDAIRRLAELNALGQKDKLADLLTDLKEAAVIQGAQVGVAQSYLAFRNRALHAQWTEVDRPEVASVLGFTEQLILKHFS